MNHATRLLAFAGFAAALAASPALAQSGKLVLYTSQPNADAQQTVDAFNAKYPDVEVEWIRDGTTKVMAKLEAEFVAGNPQPDVLLIADTVTMEGLKQDDRLMPYADADVSRFDAGLYDKDMSLLLHQAHHHRHRLQQCRADAALVLARSRQA